LNFGFSNIDFNLISPNPNTLNNINLNTDTMEDIRLRDIYDKILIKIMEKLK
jgi:hypothetical protein